MFAKILKYLFSVFVRDLISEKRFPFLFIEFYVLHRKNSLSMVNKILILHFEYYVFNFFEVGWQLRFYTFVEEKIIIKIYDIMANVIHWFEIPSKNFDRACTFYGQIMEWEIQ